MRLTKSFVCIWLALALSGCESSNEYDDLAQHMDEVRASPRGEIDLLPDFAPYEAFSYSAAGQRSPFDEPILEQVKRDSQLNQAVRPDAARVKQFLEGFALDSFDMVGTLNDDGGYHALLNLDGNVYRVKVGDYMGRNHGRVVNITESEVYVLEIIRNGLDDWVERPRTLSIKDS